MLLLKIRELLLPEIKMPLALEPVALKSTIKQFLTVILSCPVMFTPCPPPIPETS